MTVITLKNVKSFYGKKRYKIFKLNVGSLYYFNLSLNQCIYTKTCFHLDLRQSRQSLFAGGSEAGGGRTSRASSRRPGVQRQQSTRSRSRDRLTSGGSGYLAGGMLSAGAGNPDDSMNEDIDSDNWAGTSTDNNWTDYDQDIYMHRNPTHRSRSRVMDNMSSYGRDDVNL